MPALDATRLTGKDRLERAMMLLSYLGHADVWGGGKPGHHVHPALVRTAIAAKRPSRVLAITDATAAAGLPVGSRAALGGQPITAGETTAVLADGTIAGSVLTMDRAFQMLVNRVGLSLVDAATVCATTPARELGLVGHGMIAPDAPADLVILDARLTIVQTYIGGQLVYARNTPSSASV